MNLHGIKHLTEYEILPYIIKTFLNNLSTDGYRQILNENHGQFMRNFNNGNYYLIQDNAPTHRFNVKFFKPD